MSLKGILIMVEGISKERVTVMAWNAKLPHYLLGRVKMPCCPKNVRKLSTRCLGNRKACISQGVFVTI
jgi:hypothetical protein